MNGQPEEPIFATESISTFLRASREQELEALTVHAEWVAIFDRLNAAFNEIPSLVGRGLAALANLPSSGRVPGGCENEFSGSSASISCGAAILY